MSEQTSITICFIFLTIAMSTCSHYGSKNDLMKECLSKYQPTECEKIK